MTMRVASTTIVILMASTIAYRPVQSIRLIQLCSIPSMIFGRAIALRQWFDGTQHMEYSRTVDPVVVTAESVTGR